MPPLRKSKRKSMSELLHMRDSPQCQSFSVDVPLPMDGSSSLDGSHILTSTTKRGNQMASKSGMLPPRKSKKYRGDEYAKEVQAILQLTTQESSLPLADAGAKKQQVIELLKSHGGLSYIPSSTRASTSLEAAVSQYGASYGTHPVTDQNSRVLQKNVATQLEKTSVNKENAHNRDTQTVNVFTQSKAELARGTRYKSSNYSKFERPRSKTSPKRAYDKHNSSSLPTQATKSTTPKSLNSKLVSSITGIRNSKRRDSEGNKVSHLHAAKKTLQASSLKVSHLHAALSSKPLTEMKSLRPLEKSTATPCKSAKTDHIARVEKTGPSNPSMKRKMNEERIVSTSQPTSSSSTSIESSLYDIYRLQEIIRDETGKEDHGVIVGDWGLVLQGVA